MQGSDIDSGRSGREQAPPVDELAAVHDICRVLEPHGVVPVRNIVSAVEALLEITEECELKCVVLA